MLRHVWGWFLRLSARRTAGGFSANPVTWTDVAAWSSLAGVRPTAWELDMLDEAEAVYMRSMSARAKASAQK